MPRSRTLQKRIAYTTAAIAAVVGLYILCAPFAPQVVYWVTALVQSDTFEIPPAPDSMRSLITPRVSMAAPLVTGPAFEEFMTQNLVVIPRIGVHSEIVEGTSISSMDKGIWRRPKTSTPDKGGNTVLVGHRFQYKSGPRTFYHLDKVQPGDTITLFWDKERYDYIVDSSAVVQVSAFEVEQPTLQPVLTLYTCTPLLTADKRLVVRAHLVQ